MSEINKQNIHLFLSSLGFILKDGTEGVYFKKFAKARNYLIEINLDDGNFSNSKINYGEKIKKGRGTTSNFSQQENFVILECINRLLEKGYDPNCIELEKDWILGKKGKGFLDILIRDKKAEKSFLMIECKTFGEEFEAEKQKMLDCGGQLFSYYIQEPDTKYLCLYASQLSGKNIEYINEIVRIVDIFKNKNQEEAYQIWNKLFENNGLFEEDSVPYNVTFSGIKKLQLKELKDNEGRFIFNRFAEILRRNVVSDKTNAFNKIFNLFLCKIVDEDSKNNTDEMDFQWREDEDNKTAMLRLSDLYKKGMSNYLQIEIADYSQKEIDRVLSNTGKDSIDKIREMIIELRLYTNNEFAFKEVYDKETFDKNCLVVKEVVQLLQKYQLKYSTKQQFLGDFFERLLNTGIKQEAGQFFTPIPITRFICKSIPIGEIINEKNKNGHERFLPYVIDYASGSGHFLTEAMSEINRIQESIKVDWIKGGKKAKDYFNAERESYLWAKHYIYGIEKDYRLAKTSKINTFLNGDGEANIITADGLDNFKKSTKYVGVLKSKTLAQGNPVFDIIVANPPYSVDGFKNTLEYGKESFELYPYLTDKSSEIECLFLERAKQLLCEGGVAGIILPTSLLTNGEIYIKTRELLLQYFEIKAMVVLGSNTFMATGTNTVILFLRRRNNLEWEKVQQIVDAFFQNFKDVSFNGTQGVISKYLLRVHPELDLKNYIELLNGHINKNIEASETYKEYRKMFDKLTLVKKLKQQYALENISESEIETKLHTKFIQILQTIEKEKLSYFLLSYRQRIVIVNSGQKDAEKEFLGYEFSNRRGYEGIRIYPTNKMYNNTVLEDPTKVNSYILKNFIGDEIGEIEPELRPHLRVTELHELIDFSQIPFEKKVLPSPRVEIISKYDKTMLEDLSNVVVDAGTTAPQDQKYFDNGKYPFIRAINLNFKDGHNYIIPDKQSYVNEVAIKECSLKNFKRGTILFPKSGQSVTTNNIGKLKESCYIVNHLATIYDNEYEKDSTFLEYLYYILEDFKTSNLMEIGSDYPSIDVAQIGKLKVPIPPPSVQKNIVDEIVLLENKNVPLIEKMQRKKEEINKIIATFSRGKNTDKLGNRIVFEYGISLPKYKRIKGPYPVIGSNGIDGFHNEYSITGPCIVIGRKGSSGKVTFVTENCTPIDTTFYVKCDEVNLKSKYVYFLLKSLNLKNLGKGTVPGLNRDEVYAITVPIFDPNEQDELIAKIEPIEKDIEKIEDELDKFAQMKKQILNKYLQ